MKEILIIGPYPPLYSYGGPTRSIKGLYGALSGENKCKVLSPKSHLNGKKINIGLEDNDDIIYSDRPISYLIFNLKKDNIVWLNSFFELKILFIIAISKIVKFKIIVSPRGQLSKEAINTSNPLIKKVFIRIIKILSSKLTFHSTDSNEMDDILKFFNRNRIFNIKNIFSLNNSRNDVFKAKFLFFSRIHKKKGLDILLDHLINSKIDISLDIYGFIEDTNYWEICKSKIDLLKNVNYHGSIEDGDISVFKDKYSYFILPTLNENYGHIIIELISLGIIPIISKGTTPFDDIINFMIGLNFDLTSSKDFKRVISKILKLEKNEVLSLKNNVEEIFMLLDQNQEDIKKDYINLVKEL